MRINISIFIFLILFLNFGFKNNDLNSRINHGKSDSIIQLYRIFKNISPQDSVLNILIKTGEFIDTVSEDEVYANSMIIDTVKNAIRIEGYYKIGNSSFDITEYKALKFKKNIKFFHSLIVGTPAFRYQDEFQVYDYNPKNNRFSIDSLSMRIFSVGIKDYFYSNTPDSIISDYLTHSSNFFHLVYNTDGIAENVFVDNLIFNNLKDNKWIIGNTIRFTLNGNKIERSAPFFDE
jgi:hypothetical protein